MGFCYKTESDFFLDHTMQFEICASDSRWDFYVATTSSCVLYRLPKVENVTSGYMFKKRK